MITGNRVFVAVIDGVIRGTAAWAGGNIRHVSVDPDFSGRGIGTALVARAEADYQERTHHAIIDAGVVVYARAFYEQCGYVVVARENDWDGSVYYHMRKQLAAPHHTNSEWCQLGAHETS